MPEWSVQDKTNLTFDAPLTRLNVRIVNGTVNVVGTDDPEAHLQVSDVDGPPLVVTHEDGVLTVAYDDLPWKGFLKWLDPSGWRRSAVVSSRSPHGPAWRSASSAPAPSSRASGAPPR